MAAGANVDALTLLAPAKINLYLGVFNKRDAEGYHRVDSVMAALAHADVVHLEPAAALDVDMVAGDPGMGTLPVVPRERNAAWRAATSMERAFGRAARLSIHIEKHIPLQAGLGGPSADAAAVLAGICQLWGLATNDKRVQAVARSIGADVPFFLGTSPAYLAGRGDVPVEAFPKAPPLAVALVKPCGTGVSTPAAYRRFDEAPVARGALEPLLEMLREGSARPETLAPLVCNNLAPVACALEPSVAELLSWLEVQPGVLAATVCGSGSCCCALCAADETAAQVAAKARAASAQAEGNGWWACATHMENCGVRIIAG